MSAPHASTPGDWLAEFPPARSLPLDQEALRVYERAHAIGLATEPPDEPPISFSTVALALLGSADDTSRWFAQEALQHGPEPAKVRAEKGLASDAVIAEPVEGRPSDLRPSSDKQLLTASARGVLENAEEWAVRVGGSDIGVRHLLASYVINPPAAHRRQMREWKFDEIWWRQAFFAWIAPRYTAESWEDASQRAAPAKAVAAFEKTAVKGEALAFPGDEQAMAVLARAAGYHARRQRMDGWLRLQTILFALAEQARTDDDVRAAIAPLWQAISAVEQAFFDRLAAYVEEDEAALEAAAFDALNISPRVLNGLETARELAFATSRHAAQVSVLQLAAALVSRRVDNDADLAQLGLDGAALRRALIGHAAAQGQNAELWREALGEEEATPSSRPVDLSSDEPEAVIRADAQWKTDPLGIRPDVHSFAALLASRTLEPPLSIGLFGPWGSGKTTFLKRLRLVVDERAAEAKQVAASGAQSQYVANVVHVDFNAWHFAEDALVSSLVDALLRELRAFIANDHPAIGQQLLALRAVTADRARRAVEEAKAAEAAARQDVEDKAAALAASTQQAQQRVVGLRQAMTRIWTETVAAVETSPAVQKTGLLAQIGTTVQDAQDLQQRIASIRARSAPLLGALGTAGSIGFAVLVLAAPPIAAWAVQRFLGVEGVAQALSTAAAALSGVGLWLRTASAAAGRIDEAIGKVASEYQSRIDNDEGVRDAKALLDSAAAGAAGASAALAAAERALQAAQAAVAAASLPSQMLALATSRAEQATYARELTTISIARGDLQALTRLLREQSAAATAAAAAPAAPGLAAPPPQQQHGLRAVERVILYIDDLDRCSPEQVVRVLQVVHMLLAFELFVVVVAVDARWVEASLKTNYKWLAGADNAAPEEGDANPVTAQDYLEKIFQISFWLEPMTAARAAAFLKSLARPQAEAPAATPGPVSGTGLEGLGRIDIGTIELDYMRALAAHVGPSPRRVKRLVNAYRLLKARMSDAQLAAFVTDRSTDAGVTRSGPYQLVIGLMVIGTGAPALGAQILQDLAERDPRDSFERVIDDYRKRAQPDWTMAARVLETLMRTQKSSDVSELRGWARQVGRFLLQSPRG